MKNIRPLSLAVAVAAASTSHMEVAGAGDLALGASQGDMALIPYYTVQPGFSTGISVTNNSDRTQVLKIRMRRATDAMGALDFNLVLSPHDTWSGSLSAIEEAGPLTGLPVIKLFTDDSSCTVPSNAGSLTMPEIFRVGAEEGYIELIGMGTPVDESQPIATFAAPDAGGIPVNCVRVSDNFRRGLWPGDYYPDWAGFTNSSSRTRGVVNSALSAQWTNGIGAETVSNTYTDTDNVLSVSYYIRNNETGLELGNSAVHLQDFMDGATITNQTVGIFEGDLQGFDYPDLDGPAPTSIGAVLDTPPGGATARGRYEALRQLLGGVLNNDWSASDEGAFSVDTDWVVTSPGQYLMTNMFGYLTSQADPDFDCLPGTPLQPMDNQTGENCDFRDIPMSLDAAVYDRQGHSIVVEDDDVVVTPAPPGPVVQNVLAQTVNVLSWGSPVLDSARTIAMPRPQGAGAGRAQLYLVPNVITMQGICDFTGQPGDSATDLMVECIPTSSLAPLIGFAAWQRNFAGVPAANNGRIVKHSRSDTFDIYNR